MKKNMSKEEYRKALASLVYCRRELYLSNMLTEKENDKVWERIEKFQKKHQIAISQEQRHSVELVYKDKP